MDAIRGSAVQTVMVRDMTTDMDGWCEDATRLRARRGSPPLDPEVAHPMLPWPDPADTCRVIP